MHFGARHILGEIRRGSIMGKVMRQVKREKRWPGPVSQEGVVGDETVREL